MAASILDKVQRSDYADRSYRSVREIERGTTPLYQRSDRNPAYRAQLSAWYNQIMRDYKACVPQNFSFSLNFADDRKSDLDLYGEALAFHNILTANWDRMRQQHEERPKKYHIRSVELSDGSVYFIDMNGNSEADLKLIRRRDGFYDFIGTQQAFERIGGRGVVGDIVNKLEDGYYFRSKHPQKRAAVV